MFLPLLEKKERSDKIRHRVRRVYIEHEKGDEIMSIRKTPKGKGLSCKCHSSC